MTHKMFLKLGDLRGESQNPRHFGEIEISGYTWGGKHQHISVGGPGKALINDLIVDKPPDKTSPHLIIAYTRGQHFAEGRLTIEEISVWGSMIRSKIFQLKSVLITSVTADRHGDTVTLNFESMKVVLS